MKVETGYLGIDFGTPFMEIVFSQDDTIVKMKCDNLMKLINRAKSQPNITSHSFKNGLTVITWSDGTKTKCYCDPEKADEYTGFMICLAKKAFGNDNTASNLADKWLIKIPKREAEHKAKEEAEKKEQERIAANKAKKREVKRKKRMIREEARRIKEEYEREEIKSAAESLAIKEYGVPADYIWGE